ncbi:MAG: hypothetical protein AAF940_04915 [Pseudomonadota bacterium]
MQAISRLSAILIVWLLTATMASAACVTQGDAGTENSILQFYEKPDATSRARGGVRVGQCTVDVSQTCQGPWCMAISGRLLGWVDTQYLTASATQPGTNPVQNVSNEPANNDPNSALTDEITYYITGGGGIANMAGQRMNMPVDPGGEIVFSRTGTDTYSFQTPISPAVIELSRQGVAWRGVDTQWAGIAMRVEYEVLNFGAKAASIRVLGSESIASVDMVMQLERRGGPPAPEVPAEPPQPPNQTTQNNSNNAPVQPSVADQSDCGRMEAAENEVRATGEPGALAEVEEIKRQAGFTPNGRVTNGMCVTVEMRIRAEILNQANADPANGGQPENLPAFPVVGETQFCREVRDALGQAARNGDIQLQNLLLDRMRANQVFDPASATEDRCYNVLLEAGLLGSTPPGTEQASNNQDFNGEDPNTMIDGGREQIAPSEDDFAPINPAPADNANTNRAQIEDGVCQTANSAIIMIVSAGSMPEMRRLSELLNQYGLNDRFNNPPACQAMLDTLFAEGVL